MDKRILNKLGRRIKEIRKEKGLTQESLAELAQIHQTYVGKLEIGKSNPSVLMLNKLAKVLNVKIRDFFEFS